MNSQVERKKKAKKSTFNKMIDIDVSQFSKGVYVIQLQSKEAKQFKAVTKKVIVE